MDHVNNAVYADWLDEAVIVGRRRGRPSGPSRASCGWSTRGPPSPPRSSSPMPGRTAAAWVCRVADADGSDLLRARLEPIGGHGRGIARHARPGWRSR